MMTWMITIAACLTFPILGYLVIRLTKTRPNIRRRIFRVLIAFNLLAIIGLTTTVSTTSTTLDWIIASSLYLTACSVFWMLYGVENKVIKISAVIAMICVFGVSYISGTIGALGVGFITEEITPDVERGLGNGIIYKEFLLGNAISDHRGKKVEIYRTLPWLPIIEWRIQKKVYTNLVTYMVRPLIVDYKKEESKIYLSGSMLWGKEQRPVSWSDTLLLK